MSAAIVLDATPLGLLCHPRNPPHVASCRQWLANLDAAGRRILVPEIADYEIRRELLRLGSHNALINLDVLSSKLEYLPISTPAMRIAAEMWAKARSSGQPTASHLAIDADVILAAQAHSMKTPAIVATGNPKHLTQFVSAELWSKIAP